MEITADGKKLEYNRWYYILNGKLIKKLKPCLPDNYVHVHRWDGCYRVYNVTLRNFTIKKNMEFVKLEWNQFRCLKGHGEYKKSNPEKENIKTLIKYLIDKI